MKFTCAALLVLATAVNAGYDVCPEINRDLDYILEDYCVDDIIDLYYNKKVPPSMSMNGKGPMMGKKGGMPPPCNCEAQIIAVGDYTCVESDLAEESSDGSYTESCNAPVFSACGLHYGPQMIGTWQHDETFIDTTYCKSYGDDRGAVEGGNRTLQEEGEEAAAAADGDYGCCEVTGSTNKVGSVFLEGTPGVQLNFQLNYAYDPSNSYGGAGVTPEVYSITGGLPPTRSGFMKYIGTYCDYDYGKQRDLQEEEEASASDGYGCKGDEYDLYTVYACAGAYDTCAIWDESEVDRLMLPNCDSPYGCDYSEPKRRMEGQRKLSRKVKAQEAE
ncbi:MAG: hypothetical protein SGARI_001269, partial [Bacillariaceae sp.]